MMKALWLPPWESAEWRAEAELWIGSQLDGLGFKISGPIEQPHVRPWSTVMRIATSQGDIYFKAGAPNQVFEPALTRALAGWGFKDALPPLAVDLERGWLLLPGGGSRLREWLAEHGDHRKWAQGIAAYASLQINSAPYAGRMLALGLADYRPDKLPAVLHRVLDDEPVLMLDTGDGITTGERERLRALIPEAERMAAELAAIGLPAAIEHGDMHDANIFFDGARFVFFDWGDASVGHPFFSMLVTQRVIAGQLDLPDDSPELAWVRDAYLGPWEGFAPREELVAAYSLAQCLGKLTRIATWYGILKLITPQAMAEYRHTVPVWLKLFLADFPER
jgi:hypothetical protein